MSRFRRITVLAAALLAVALTQSAYDPKQPAKSVADASVGQAEEHICTMADRKPGPPTEGHRNGTSVPGGTHHLLVLTLWNRSDKNGVSIGVYRKNIRPARDRTEKEVLRQTLVANIAPRKGNASNFFPNATGGSYVDIQVFIAPNTPGATNGDRNQVQLRAKTMLAGAAGGTIETILESTIFNNECPRA